jgi:hypothetical protein
MAGRELGFDHQLAAGSCGVAMIESCHPFDTCDFFWCPGCGLCNHTSVAHPEITHTSIILVPPRLCHTKPRNPANTCSREDTGTWPRMKFSRRIICKVQPKGRKFGET